MTIEISLLIAGASLAFAVAFGAANAKRNSKSDDKIEATQMTTVIVKLENIGNICTEIKGELNSIKADVKGITERMIVVEGSLESAWKCIEELKQL